VTATVREDAHAARRHPADASRELSSGSVQQDRRLAAEDRREAARVLAAAYRDDTTGALNRGPGRAQLQMLLDRGHREASALTFVFLDVDGLKEVNDSKGHRCGDALLAALGRALRDGLRSYDVVVRYGGDEFVCALPGGTVDVAEAHLERVRSVLQGMVEGATVSSGYAELQATDTLDEVIGRADDDLYRRRRLEQAPRRNRPTPVRGSPTGRSATSVACGECGNRVTLTDFVLELSARMTRFADCPACGATTVIQLLQPLGPPDGL
jgi:diguanylate cyclase (GGDEF)-like protein